MRKTLSVTVVILLSVLVFAQSAPPIASRKYVEITGTLSSAQILAFNPTPVQIISAQGPGTLIYIDSSVWELVFNSAAYSGSGQLELLYGSGPLALSTVCAGSFIISPVNRICTTGNLTPGGVSSGILNVPISVSSTIAETGGDSSVNYWIKYHVLTGL